MDLKYTPKSISLALLTFNRKELVEKVVAENIRRAGIDITEVIWCDNGSTDGTVDYLNGLEIANKKILNKENLGIAKGYNAIYKECSGDYIARPGTDMLMPHNWLLDMITALDNVEQSGIVGMISKSYIESKPKRFLGERNGVMEANVLGSIVFRRSILDKGLFLNENLSKYGYEDTLWTKSVRDNGYLNFYIDGVAEDFQEFEVAHYQDYINFKMSELDKTIKNNPELLDLDKNING